MALKRKLGRHSFFDAPALKAFLEDGLGDGKRDTADRHRRTIQAAAVAAADRGLDTVDVDAIPNLPGFARERLHKEFTLLTSSVDSTQISSDGTTKFVVLLQDGHRVESVLMRHDGGRNTLCVSSQVGCKMGCTFCATGTLGELGNLTGGEILEQLAHARAFVAVNTSTTSEENKKTENQNPASTAVTNVVFMGMGEPLNNYDAVIGCISPMSDAKIFHVAPSRITVSTVGVVPKMLQLTKDFPEVRLALSLHAPTQALREKIVPTATAYPLPKIMKALDTYLAAGSRQRTRAMIEYCVLGGVNDTETHARQLGELLKGKDVIVNLIPFNPTDTPMGHLPPTYESVQAMAAVLAAPPFNHRTTVRKEMGQDIAGACGQLALNSYGGLNKSKSSDVEDLGGAVTSKSVKGVGTQSEKPGKGTVVTARPSSSRSDAVEAPDEMRVATHHNTKTKQKVPRNIVLAVTILNTTAAVAMAVLAFAGAWKLAWYVGLFETSIPVSREL